MFIFFFSIPMFLVATVILGIAGLAFPAVRTILDLGNTVAQIVANAVSWGLIILVALLGILVTSLAIPGPDAAKKINIPVIIYGVYSSILSILALLRFKSMERLSFMFLFSIIFLILMFTGYSAICSKRKVLKYVLTTVCIAAMTLPVGWVIGYDMNYNSLVSQKNVAYYYCEDVLYESGVGKEPTFVYDENGNVVGAHVDRAQLTGFIFQEDPSPEQVVGTYEKGDRLIPDRSKVWIKHKESDAKYLYDMLWYPVFTKEGVPGYVRYDGLQVFYRGSGEWVDNSRQEIIDSTWYRFCPKFLFSFSEKIFGICPLGYTANIENDESLFL